MNDLLTIKLTGILLVVGICINAISEMLVFAYLWMYVAHIVYVFRTIIYIKLLFRTE